MDGARKKLTAEINCSRYLQMAFSVSNSQSIWQEREKRERRTLYRDRKLQQFEERGESISISFDSGRPYCASDLSLSARDKKSPLYCSFPFSDPSWRFSLSLSLSTRAYIGCWDPQSLFFSIASSTLNFFVLRGCKYLPSAVCCGAISQQRHKKQYGDLGEV